MNFEKKLIPGRLLKRYKRFFADVQLDNGEVVTAHCPNTGSMLGCAEAGMPVWLSEANNPGRKLKFTWEVVEVKPGVKVGVNTALPNKLVHEAIVNGVIKELQGFTSIRSEVKYGQNNASRIDLLLEGPQHHCYVEVKNVTALVNGRAAFPDAVTTRGQKHIRELMDVVGQGHRGVMFFCVQRTDCDFVTTADEIDPEYGRLLRQAKKTGVEVLAYKTNVSDHAIVLHQPLEVELQG